jgi:hypothetical protein
MLADDINIILFVPDCPAHVISFLHLGHSVADDLSSHSLEPTA